MSQLTAILCPRLIPGKLASGGASAALIEDIKKWPYQAAQISCHDLLATSSYCEGSGEVIIIDMNSMQLVQTLHGHASPVTSVQWNPTSPSCSHQGLLLFTGDRTGVLKVWNVTEGATVNSVQLPSNRPICAISLVTKKRILVVTQDSSCFVYDSHLSSNDPCDDPQLTFALGTNEKFIPLCVRTSKLSEFWTSCVVLGDRIGMIYSQDQDRNGKSPRASVKNLVFESTDGFETVVDAVFSESQEGLLYFATRNSVGVYDCRANLLLDENVLRYSAGDGEFRRIFSSAPSTLTEDTQQLPLLYSYGSNQRLTAWYLLRVGKATSVSTDVRGARIASKVATNVIQSLSAPNVFAVIFSDGSVARWRYRVDCRRWVIDSYFSAALKKPTGFCVLGDNTLCCALEAGYLALVDVAHSNALRRINFVNTSNTHIILLAPHSSKECVWVVTNKAEQSKQHHQVTLFDCHSGVVLQVLREPKYSDATRMKNITQDATGTFLLLTFFGGTFEVWNITESRIIYSYEGTGVASASWAPQIFTPVLAGLKGAPELLLIVFSDGSMSFWTVSWDQVVPNRDAVPRFPNGSSTRVLCTPTRDASVVVDGSGAVTVVGVGTSGLHVRSLKDIPAAKTAIALAVSKGGGGSDNKGEPSDAGNWSEEYLAVVFSDGSFGVWSISSQERMGYSKNTDINLKARGATWLGDALLLLTLTGNIVVVDKLLTSINSSVFSKALRRPLQNSAFFVPEHRMHIQTVLETQVACSAVPSEVRPSSDICPSCLIRGINPERFPCRGPFGQVITAAISSLTRELDLYRKTMVPRYIYEGIQHAFTQSRTDEIALWVARFFGQQERQRLWMQFCLRRGLNCSGAEAGGDGGQQSKSVERWKGGPEVGPPVPYYCADRFSEVSAASEVVYNNHVYMNERRAEALEASKGKEIDVFSQRFLTARELLKLQQPQKAIDVLMDVSHEDNRFPHLSDFAVAISASVAALSGPASELLTLTTSRVASLLRARGDLDSAVDKYMLSGHFYEAVKALQLSGKWGEGAVLAKLSPLPAKQQRDLICRWCSHLVRHGQVMEAAVMLASQALPFQVLVLLSESSQFEDIAGLLAMVLLEDPSFNTRESLQEPIVLPVAEDDSSDALTLGEVLLNVLVDYANMLNTVGNVVSAKAVLEYVTSLKGRNRGITSTST
ncbi:hypothetical protein, conserved [Trypanosoma brucei gambiense DAL972]|uniref:Uncharacterized protein n=1 Tax=Trypanosoma brucei gambiense (strain MHOM/CI/86/DAL972) TaxID=679716 RepID=C9ZLU7_TRYB9|nr:hypothetical protein, conserved [Trypanosoma brucei gambiense DAL972]CBH10372.1 hypothetical protein, conserved [Trypanosoma brucei gambiense DAL972]|eukprot:XP_011772662.1 hypothetical protein, conserved [Trypanosoma brucei gambiense DAL972]